MTTINPTQHLERAAHLAKCADAKIDTGIREGGDTEFTNTLIRLAELHLRLAATAAALVPVPMPIRPLCPMADLAHAPHDGCEGTLQAPCGAKLPHASHGACSGVPDPLAEQQKRGEL